MLSWNYQNPRVDSLSKIWPELESWQPGGSRHAGRFTSIPDESPGWRIGKVRKNLIAPSAKMQGAAYGGLPKQATPQRVVDAGQRSRLDLAARENFSVFL